MGHPTIEAIEKYLVTGEPAEVGSHLQGCEECESIAEGLRIVVIEAEKRQISSSELIENSALRSRAKVREYEEQVVKQKPTYRLWWSVAAVLLLIATVTFLMPKNRSLESEMTAELSEIYVAPLQVRSGEVDQIWSTFRQEYIEQDFDGALSLIDDLPEDIMNTEKHFYKGLSMIYSMMPDYKKAVILFEKLAKEESRYAERAQWFQSLCLIQLEQYEVATPLLKSLVENKKYKAMEAQVLLDLMP